MDPASTATEPAGRAAAFSLSSANSLEGLHGVFLTATV
jgi:hypothetical protein